MNKKILRLAIPNIISNVTIPLLGIVDLAILGHLGIAAQSILFGAVEKGFGGCMILAFNKKNIKKIFLTDMKLH
ncbi:hypothetical protein ACFLSY_11940 [Bacteroidota bacterium]